MKWVFKKRRKGKKGFHVLSNTERRCEGLQKSAEIPRAKQQFECWFFYITQVAVDNG
jgi:hypothetical protein